MKKFIILVVVMIVAIAGAFMIMMYLTFKNNSAIQDGQILNNFATVIKDGMVSCYIFDTGKSEVGLIDACNDPEGKAILAVLKKKGLGPEAVHAVFLTHGDRDHTAACPLFKNAKIYCMKADIAIAEGKEKSVKPISFLFRLKPMNFKVTDILQDGETVRSGNVNVQVFSIPGHTKGSAAFLAGGVLFLGDSVMAGTNGKLALSSYFFSESQSEDQASLKTLALRLKPMANNIKVLAPSHTGPLMGLQPLLDLAEKN
jgi:glyoxylase-like metal-dependent hydrolase (beta-lactamase superfamily II)